MSGARAFLGVGSNRNPHANVRALLALLEEQPRVHVTGISTFYRTPPLPGPGAREQDPDYLNGVLEVRTLLTREELTALLVGIELRLGRRRTGGRFASRTLDVDILLYLAADAPPLPAHPDVLTRAFVALSLLELAPELHLPPDGRPLAEEAARFSDPGGEAEVAFTLELRNHFLPPPDRDTPS